jgi:hypothetical protein
MKHLQRKERKTMSMRKPVDFDFNLFTFHWWDAFFIEICHVNMCLSSGQELEGSLFSIYRGFEGTWEFDFLYYRVFALMFWNWKENRYIQRDRNGENENETEK